MKTIGQIIKDARVGKSYSIVHLEEVTKIKSGFIEAIELEKWDKLPPFPTVLGFVKSLSTTLDIDPKMSVAVLKRDYPPKKLSINPKPDVSSVFTWSPKLTFAIGVGLILTVIFGYLIFQYIHFISPPHLTVESPKEGQVVTGNSVAVFGVTETDAKIYVNDQPVLVDDNGNFSTSIGVSKDTKEVDVVSTSRSGKSTLVKRKITVQ